MENENAEIKIKKNIILVGILLTIIVSAAVGAFTGFLAGSGGRLISSKIFSAKNGEKSNSVINQQTTIEEDSAVIDVVEKSSPAVVSIIISKDIPKYRSFFGSPFDEFGFFGSPQSQRQGAETEKQKIGGGSGFLVSKEGLIVTNKHVVEDLDAEYTVVNNKGKKYPVKVLSRHPAMDIALIKIEGGDFPTLEMGSSDNLKVGQTVVAIGNSLGEFSNSVSKGIVSGLKRNITAGSGFGATEKLSNIIQTDAAINPGNSGGPLLDIAGKVIGVNVAMAQGAENVGFALPANQVQKFIEQVEKNGKVSIPYLGVRYVVIDKSIQKANNLEFSYGALVLRGENRTDLAVVPGSPADKAGIVENDIILEIEGKKIDEDNGLSEIINQYDAGVTITLKVWHKGETKEIKVKLEERK